MTSRAHQKNLPAQGLRILLVEDDFFVADDLRQHLLALGADVVGPAPDLGAAERLVSAGDRLDLVLLDFYLSSQTVVPLAEDLTARNIPYAFVTGLDPELIPEHLRDIPVLLKPFSPEALATLICGGAKTQTPSRFAGNQLLGRLPDAIVDLLRPHMSQVPLVPHRSMLEANAPTKRVLFPQSGLLSLLLGPRDASVEIALVGNEGLVGGWTLDDELSPYEVIVHSPGFAIAIDVHRFLEVVRGSAEARDLLMRFQHVLSVQIASGAVANASDKLDARLARWLLMCADRLGPSLFIVHEFASLMLNVRRAGITTALHVLEGEHAIRATRSKIEVTDRERLKTLASPMYGVPERAYDRLIGCVPEAEPVRATEAEPPGLAAAQRGTR